KEMARQISALTAPYCIVAIPLLIENGPAGIADRILVVDAPERLQLERAMRRDKQTEDEITAIIASQASRAARLAAADDIIHNHSNLKALKQQVEMLHRKYLATANAS
ncbi:MAG: dephospho-CoA kinase, partial [Cohaesibacteraceae bacterium]|nr:dephospho-CoA kinase [Cohaesibacteraceae bacterium]